MTMHNPPPPIVTGESKLFMTMEVLELCIVNLELPAKIFW